MKVGDLVNARKWNHCTPNATFSFGIKRGDKRTAVMMYLGNEPLDGSDPLDLETVMRRLGWQRITHATPQ